jgi:signal transduction histidine kinase
MRRAWLSCRPGSPRPAQIVNTGISALFILGSVSDGTLAADTPRRTSEDPVVTTKTNGPFVKEMIHQTIAAIPVQEISPRVDWSELCEAEHFVQFYETDAFLLNSLSGFIGTGLSAGEAGIIVATPAHREGLEEHLQASGLDIVTARASGQFVMLDADETLSRFMLDGSPDARRFAEVVGGIITRAAAGRRRVRIFGEMVALLWAEGNYDAAIRLEELWNDLRKTHAFVLCCAYPINGFGGAANAAPLNDVCAEHARVIPAESYTALADSDDRLRAIIQLQQKAQSLEAEIAQRKAAENALHTVLEARDQLLIREHMARAEAERANRLKDQFLCIAAHELRTPLTTLMGQAQLFQRRAEREGHLPERDLRSLRIMNDQVARLAKLVLALLDVSRLEMGQLTLECANLDLCALVRRVVREIAPTVEDRWIEIICPDQPMLVNGDELRLEQVLQNLIQNAVKYSHPPDPIMVTVTPHVATVCVSVQDWGMGIPRDALPNVFQRFYRAKNVEDQYISGMGIGLHVVKEIVSLHAGTVAVESSEGAGSTFTVCLPLLEERDPA